MILLAKHLLDWLRLVRETLRYEFQQWKKDEVSEYYHDAYSVVDKDKVAEAKPLVKPESDFDKAKKVFNPNKDILVISENHVPKLPLLDQVWLKDQGERVYYFPGKDLINVALVSNAW